MREFSLLSSQDVEVPCGERVGSFISELMEVVGGEVDMLRLVIRFGVRRFFEVVRDERDGTLRAIKVKTAA